MSQKISNIKRETIITCETNEAKNIKQLVICVRWVDDQLNTQIEFTGQHPVLGTTADTMVSVFPLSIFEVFQLLENLDNK